MPRGRERGEGYARKVAAKQKVRERSVEKCEIFHIKWGKMKASFVSVSVCGESHLFVQAEEWAGQRLQCQQCNRVARLSCIC